MSREPRVRCPPAFRKKNACSNLTKNFVTKSVLRIDLGSISYWKNYLGESNRQNFYNCLFGQAISAMLLSSNINVILTCDLTKSSNFLSPSYRSPKAM